MNIDKILNFTRPRDLYVNLGEETNELYKAIYSIKRQIDRLDREQIIMWNKMEEARKELNEEELEFALRRKVERS